VSHCLRNIPCPHRSLYNCVPKCSWHSWTAWPLKLERLGCPETLVTNYQSMLHNTPEEWRSKSLQHFLQSSVQIHCSKSNVTWGIHCKEFFVFHGCDLWVNRSTKELYIQSFKSKCLPDIRKNRSLTSDIEMLQDYNNVLVCNSSFFSINTCTPGFCE